MKSLEKQSIGQIVAEDYRTAQVFNHYKLDFCCSGSKTISEACEQTEIKLPDVLKELAALGNGETENKNYNTWSLDFLTDYINSMHQINRAKMPKIIAYVKKVAKAHRSEYPELIEIQNEFENLSKELTEHMDKEERSLLPYIKKLTTDNSDEANKSEADYVSDSIEMIEHDRGKAGVSLDKIRELSDDFAIPDDACATYITLLKNLEAFDRDTRKHVHLENNILFPKALELNQKQR